MATKKGTAANDTLSGTGGADVLLGLAGADRLKGGAGNDRLNGGTGADVLDGGSGNDTLNGEAGNDVLIGGAGNDVLNGGAGVDALRGDAGDDRYVIDGSSEIARARLDAGIDTVQSSVSYTLGAQQEKLTLLGSAAINATGNALANVITGNGAANVLDGRAGSDALRGAGGNDVLVFDLNDREVNGGSGTDTLLVSTRMASLTASQLAHASALEVIDLRTAFSTHVTLDAALVTALNADGSLRIRADGNDAVTVVGSWERGADVTLDGQLHHQYSQDAKTLQIDANAMQVVGGAVAMASLGSGQMSRFDGTTADDRSGGAVAMLGDVNGDGFDDFVIGARGADPGGLGGSGASYVVFGNGAGPASSVALSALNGSDGFRLDGVALGDASGDAVGAAGDVNGDGLADILIGASAAAVNGSLAGAGYIVFGAASFAATVSLSALSNTSGVVINGLAAGDGVGAKIVSAGDVNSDGFDDVIIAASGADFSGTQAGASYVVFGRATGLGGTLDLSLLDGSNGFRIDGVAAADRAGAAVSGAGDFNGDGFADLIIGAPHADSHDFSYGASYIVFGKAAGFGATLALADLNGDAGFRLLRAAGDDRSGDAVSAAGDVNGDGFGDVLVGASNATAGGLFSGAAYVVFGREASPGATLDVGALDGSNGSGFRIGGLAPFDHLGGALHGAGDVNADGYDDVLLGTSGNLGYLIFGQGSGFSANFNLATLDGINGLRLDGVASGDGFALAVGGGGDINGDGFADVVLGAASADPDAHLSAGASYVLYGRNFTDAVAQLGGSSADSLLGTSADETLVGAQGNDTLNGAAGVDVLRGGAGDDVLVWDANDRDDDGGSGIDTLRIDGSGQTLDLAALGAHGLGGIERIDISGSGDNSLSLTLSDVLALPDQAGAWLDAATVQLLVSGDSGDSVQSVGQGWQAGADVLIDGVTYLSFVHADSAAQLLIDSDITHNVS